MKKSLPLVSFLVFLCLVNSFRVHAQSNFQPGFIITIDGKKIEGEIDYKGWYKNPDKITFKAVSEALPVSYTVSDINYFEVAGKDAYQRAEVWIDRMPVTADKLSPASEKYDVFDTVFLRLLVKGDKLSLFLLSDEKEHFFIQPSSAKMEELVYKKGLDRETRIVTYDGYKYQLQKLAGENNDLIDRIHKSSYTQKDLVKIVKQLNGDNESFDSRVSIFSDKKVKKLQFFAGGGPRYNTLDFDSPSYPEYHGLKNSESPIGFHLKAGMEFYPDPRTKKMFFRLELTYGRLSYHGEEEKTFPFTAQKGKDSYFIKQNTISPALAANFKIYNKENFSLFIGGDVAGNFSSYPQNLFISENYTTGTKTETAEKLQFEKVWVDYHARLGTLFQQYEISLGRRITGDFNNSENITMKNNCTELTLAYRF